MPIMENATTQESGRDPNRPSDSPTDDAEALLKLPQNQPPVVLRVNEQGQTVWVHDWPRHYEG
jgi:hypothetical protein